MKLLLFINVVILSITKGFAQETLENTATKGIQFIYAENWEEVMKIAKRKKKYVFVDCYATWCGPCRYMADSIFTKESVGNYMNRHFLNIKIQMDRTERDSCLVNPGIEISTCWKKSIG